MRGGYYRPFCVHRMRGAVRDGKIEAWSDTIVGQSIMKGSPFEAMTFKDGLDPTAYEGSNEIPYEVAELPCDLHQVDVGVPVLWWRSVGHTHTGYAVEAFVDELLEAAGQDPVEGRLALMAKKPRHAGVLKAVAELADWKNDQGCRTAAPAASRWSRASTPSWRRSSSCRWPTTGPKVHKVWCAVDCGVAVNPDIIRAQMEGGIGFGLGHILYAEQTLDEGAPVSGNFDTYRSLRINEMPEIEVVDRQVHREAERASASPACRRSGRRSPMRWRSSGSDGRGNCRSCREHRHEPVQAMRCWRWSPAASRLGCSRSPSPDFERGRCRAEPANPTELQPVSAFAKIKDKNERAVALFQEAGKVIQSPRCMNCHPATRAPDPDRPDAAAHSAGGARRGRHRARPAALPARTCHHEANFDPAGVPGNPKWALAPVEMAWQGKTLGQICEQIKDKERNGGKDMAALVHHMAEDELVGWGWHPGGNRTPAPGTQKQFGELIKAWADAGAACPKG